MKPKENLPAQENNRHMESQCGLPAKTPTMKSGWLAKVAKITLKWVAIVFGLLLALAIFSGTPFLFETLWYIAFGWFIFLYDSIGSIRFNEALFFEALICMAALFVGAHYFCAWLYSQAYPDANSRWRTRWTTSGLVMVMLLFVAGLSTIGLSHQIAWLFSIKEPMLVDNYTSRFHIYQGIELGSDAKAAVSAFLLENGKAPISNAQAGVGQADNISNSYVESVSIGKNGVIIIRYHKRVAGGGVVKLIPSLRNDVVEWSCNSSYPPKHLPVECRP